MNEETQMVLCKCGCGKEVSKDGNNYINGHFNKGKTFSEETKRRMRKPKSEEHKRKLSETKKGEKHPFFGKKRPLHSDFMKRNNPAKTLDVRKKLKGENNPNWKGGISFDPYCRIFSDKDFRYVIFKRDKYSCQNCGITRMLSLKVYGRELIVHHINYNKKDCETNNVISVCNSCNAKSNFNRSEWQKYYSRILENRIF